MAGKTCLFEGQARRRGQLGGYNSTPCPTPCWARMQGHYPGNRGVRPHGVRGFELGEAPPARLFLCAECRAHCAGDCAQRARRRNQTAAGRRYQSSRRGRHAHAVRARRYRAQSKKVTHQGSPPPPTDDLLPSGSPMIAGDAASSDDSPRGPALHCHWCGRRCPGLVRQGFLRRRVRRRGPLRHDRTGPKHGDAA
jgi:hypothetical protein